MQRFVHLFFAFTLLHKNLFAAEPADIFLQAAGHGVNGAQTGNQFLLGRYFTDAVLAEVAHQMVKRYIIVYKPMCVGVGDLRFLGDTGRQESELIRNPHILARIDCCAKHRAMYRHQFGQQFRDEVLNVAHHRRTGLGNAALKVVFLDVLDIGPCGDIRAECNIDDTAHSHLLECSEDITIILRIIGNQRGGIQGRNFLPAAQICQKLLGIIIILACMMLTHIQTGTACNALGWIDVHKLFFPLLHHRIGG